MGRGSELLTNREVQTATKPGLLGDGRGLYLKVTLGGGKSWILRYMLAGKRHDMGIGPYPEISLAMARAKALEARRLRIDGVDPLAARRAAKAQAALASAAAVTFREAAERYLKVHAAKWSNPKHAAQWTATLATYAYPTMGPLPVAGIETSHVLAALEPIWTEKAETASRVRQRIETILSYAMAQRWRPEGLNPARLKGNIDVLLPARGAAARVEHHAAVDWRQAPKFWRTLETQAGVGAMALRFCILTASRTSETLGATWDEIDADAALWTIPGERMKARRAHRVPLSPAALEILKALREISSGPHIFPGMKRGKPLSNMSLLAVLKRMGRDDVTTHGFRSTFRDWGSETGAAPEHVMEMSLAHTVGNKLVSAYRRGDLLEQRATVMRGWAAYLTSPIAECGK